MGGTIRMRFNKAVSIMLTYIFLVSLFSAGIPTEKVYAAEGDTYKVYNALNTPIPNKYNIAGKYNLDAIRYADSTVINTDTGFYVIQNDNTKAYDITGTYIGRHGSEDYLVSQSYNKTTFSYDNAKILKVDSTTSAVSSQEVTGFPSNTDMKIQGGVVDKSGNSWFNAFSYNDEQYKLLRVGTDGSAKIYVDNQFLRFEKLSSDNEGNIIFMGYGFVEGSGFGCKIVKFQADTGKCTTIYTGGVEDYRLAQDGSIWFISFDDRTLLLRGGVL
jgi:hypothetical protein